MTASDAELLAAWRAGDRRAGEALFERHFDAVYRFFRTKLPDAAEDFTQRVFLACVEGRDRFRGEASVRTYLLAIARRMLLAHWRDRKPAADPSVSSVEDLEPGPRSLVAERQEHRLLLGALRRLPVDLQIALELHYWEGMTSFEVAAVLDIPDGTARSRLRRAREQLIEQLGALAEGRDLLESTLGDLDGWAASLRGLVSSGHGG